MVREEICKKNYYLLFGDKALAITGDDPEILSILQKYIFVEIFTIGELDIRYEKCLQ